MARTKKGAGKATGPTLKVSRTVRGRASTARKPAAGSKRLGVSANGKRRGRGAGEILPPAPPGTTALVIVESPAKAQARSASTWAAAIASRRRSGTCAICRRRSSASMSTTGSSPNTSRSPERRRRWPSCATRRKDSREVYLATDPDREGEAIAWHVAGQLPRRGSGAVPIRRALFHEITKDAVQRGDRERRRDRRAQGQRAAGAARARPAGRLQGESGPLEDREEGLSRRVACRPSRSDCWWSASARSARSRRSSTGPSPPTWRRPASGSSARLHQVDGKKPDDLDRSGCAAHRRRDPGGGGRAASGDERRVRRRQRCAGRVPGHGPQAARAAQESAGAVHHQHAAAGSGQEAGLRVQAHHAAGAGPLRGRGAGRRRRGRPHHLHAYGLHAGVGVGGRAGARVPADTFGAEFLADGPRLYADSKKNAQDAHEAVRPTDPQRPSGIGAAVSHSGPVQALSAGLAAFHGVADGARRVRHHDGGLRPGDLSAPGHGQRGEVPGLPGRVPRSARGGRGPDARGRAGPAGAGEGRARAGAGRHAHAALHRATAPILGSQSGQGAGAARHRPAVDLRVDHLHPRRPALRAARAASVLPDAAGRQRRESDGEAVPRCLQRGLHVGDGRGAGQDRRRAS